MADLVADKKTDPQETTAFSGEFIWATAPRHSFDMDGWAPFHFLDSGKEKHHEEG